MSQIACAPTKGNSYLDLILTTSPHQFSPVRVCRPAFTSKHSLVSCFWHLSYCKSSAGEFKRNFTQANYDNIATELSAIDWPYIFARCQSVKDYWDMLYSVLNRLIQVHVPNSLGRHFTGKRLPRHVHAVIQRQKIRLDVSGRNFLPLLLRHNIIVCPSNADATFVSTECKGSLTCYQWLPTRSTITSHVSFILKIVTFFRDKGSTITESQLLAGCFSNEYSTNFTPPFIGPFVQSTHYISQPIIEYLNVDVTSVRDSLASRPIQQPVQVELLAFSTKSLQLR